MKQTSIFPSPTVLLARLPRWHRWQALFLAAVWALAASAQSKINVTGTVLDSNGEALIGASVVVKGNTSQGTVTDFDGHFTLTVPSESAVLVFSYVGMTSKEVLLGKQRTLRITLKDNTELGEVVVVGYGQQKKASVVGAIT